MLNPRYQVIRNSKFNNFKLMTPDAWTDYIIETTIEQEVSLVRNINDIVITTSLDNLTETAEIKIHKSFIAGKDNKSIWVVSTKIKNPISLNKKVNPMVGWQHLSLGNCLEINLGYYNINKSQDFYDLGNVDEKTLYTDNQRPYKRFMGHIHAIGQDQDYYILKLKDNMGVLNISKQVNLSIPKISITELLNKFKDKTIMGERTYDIKYRKELTKEKGVDVDIVPLECVNMTIGEIFKKLKDERGVCFYFKHNYLYFLFKYQNINFIGKEPDYGKILRFTSPMLPGFHHQNQYERNGTNGCISVDMTYNDITSTNPLFIISVSSPILPGVPDKQTKNKTLIAKKGVRVDGTIIKTFEIKVGSSDNELASFCNSNGFNTETKIDEKDGQWSNIVNFNIRGVSFETTKQYIEKYYNEIPRYGFEGNFTTIGLPVVEKGDILLLNFDAIKTSKDKNNFGDMDKDYILPIWIDLERYSHIPIDSSNLGFNILFDNIIVKNGIEQYEKELNGFIENYFLPFYLYIANDVEITYGEGGLKQKIGVKKFSNKDLIPLSVIQDSIKINKSK